MKRAAINFAIDTVSLILGVTTLGTGLVLAYALPPLTGRHELALLGLHRHDWGDIHFYIALTLSIFITLHLSLHLTFFKQLVSETLRKNKRIKPKES